MPIKSPKEKTRRIMGLAASQARLLTLTSDKLHLEKQISINTNRKMALTAEMSRLAFEKNSKLNSYQYQVSTLDGGMHEINYEYLMGKSGGVQDISTKSEDKMMLFDSASGKVILSEDMANIIGPIQDLRNNQNQKYEAIARLCGDAHLTVPEDLPSNIDISFCADTELIKDICNGKYNSYGLNDLTRAISRYNLYSYATNNDGACGNLIPAQQQFVPAGQNTEQWLSSFDKLINDVKFYAPIVDACIKFGYTTKYDDYIKTDKSYVDESLQNGTFQIMDFDVKSGDLDGSHNTKYYLRFSEIYKMQDENQKLEVQAWYQKEKSSIKHKEDVLDTMINQMNTELNSINTEIESIKSFIDDSKKKFEWCKG